MRRDCPARKRHPQTRSAHRRSSARTIAHDDGADLQKFETDGGGLRPAQFGAVQSDAPDSFQEHVGRGGKQQSQLVGPPTVAARPVGKEPELLFLDPVFHLAAGAVNVVVDGLGVAWEGRDHKARIAPLVAVLGLGDDPPRKMIRTCGQACRSRVTSSLRIAGACRAASRLLGRR